MITDNLQLFLHNFGKHNQTTKHNQVWLVCDNHDSHISVEVLDYKIGIVMLSFTPHCSHKLQYLDHTVHEHFYNSCESCMHYNTGKALTIYETQSTDMDRCFYPNSVTPANIQSGELHWYTSFE